MGRRWKKTIISGAATSLERNLVNTAGVVSPALSKKMPKPLMTVNSSPPYLSVNLIDPSPEDRTRCVVGKRSSASACH